MHANLKCSDQAAAEESRPRHFLHLQLAADRERTFSSSLIRDHQFPAKMVHVEASEPDCLRPHPDGKHSSKRRVRLSSNTADGDGPAALGTSAARWPTDRGRLVRNASINERSSRTRSGDNVTIRWQDGCEGMASPNSRCTERSGQFLSRAKL
jgi:hypothetical protein